MYKEYFKNITSHEGARLLLDQFLKNKLKFYKQYRNQDFGDFSKNFVSGLSPVINRRLITEYEVIDAISNYFQYNIAEKFIDEICWRTYWKGWLEHRPNVWYDYLNDLITLKDEKKINKIYKSAINGKTGLDCFDTWAKELKKYGYLHNHARMWFASIWIFYFQIPWQLGAEFFYHNLLDADPASNTLSWRWVAGLQTKGKYYIASQNNIDRFTGNRFNFPSNFFIKEKEIFENKLYDPQRSNLYQKLFPHLRKGYLIHEEDLSLSFIDDESPIIIQSKAYNPLGQTSLPQELANITIDNTINKCKKNFSKNNISTFDWINPEKIKSWISKNHIELVEVIAPTVGKFNNLIPETLETLNVEISYKYHDWDLEFWRYTDKGFFKLKKQIKNIIRPIWNGPLFQNHKN